MPKVVAASKLPGLVAAGVVVFAFWPALLGGGSFVANDIVIHHAAPFDFYQSADFTLETDSTDPINIHAHWAALASDVRSGDVGWWTPDLAGGQPTMKGGLPVFNLGYLVAPGWYAPGLVAALRTLTAIGLTYGFVRSLGLLRVSALTSGIAFAFCGFMVSWMNWPQSSVAALAPGLLWAVEKLVRDPKLWRAVPLGAVVAAMVWSNFPQVTILVSAGAVVYGAIRLVAEIRTDGPRSPGPASGDRVSPGETAPRSTGLLARRRFATVGGYVAPLAAAVVIAGLLAAPHLIAFAQYLDWGDTSYRGWSSVDSAAGVEYLLTLVAPAVWGHGSFGPLWFGEFGWNEPHVYAGASVFLLALLGFAAGVRHKDRRCRAAVLAFAVLCGLGVLVGFVGGPITDPLRAVAGDQFGALARAKVLLNLGIALGAAFGVERLASSDWSGPSASLRRSALVATTLATLLTLALAPAGLVWFRAVSDEGVLRQVLGVSIVPCLSAVAVVVAVAARARGSISGAGVGWLLVGVVGYEMLSFVMPVHTVAERDERLTATPAHVAVRELLGPGERLSGEGWTFFPSTTALFDIDDARGHVIKSPGYNALLRAEVPDAITVGEGRATPTWPYIPFDADVSSPVWDAMAVRVWAQFPDSLPVGTLIEAPSVSDAADPSAEPIKTTLSSPAGGLRAVVFEVASALGGPVEVTVEAAGLWSREVRDIAPQTTRTHSFAFAGEDLPARTPVSVTVGSPAPAGRLLVAVDAARHLAAGMVAGDDEFKLVRTGDVLLTARPHARFVRIVDAVQLHTDTRLAAQAVADRTVGERSVVLDADVGLPTVPSTGAALAVTAVELERDRVEARVRSDRRAVVVFSVSHYPGWTATVNGEPAAVVTADAAYMAVAVAAGEHVVTLTFRPQHLSMSMLSMACGVVLALGLLCVGLFRRRPTAASAA